MDLLERVFGELIQRNYRHHDVIQKSEDEKLERKSLELIRIDELAEGFERKMELAANEMEQWLIKHKRN